MDDCDAVAVALLLGDGEHVPEADALEVGDAVIEADTEAVRLAVWDALGVLVPVGLTVCEGVGTAESEGVCVAAWVGRLDGVASALGAQDMLMGAKVETGKAGIMNWEPLAPPPSVSAWGTKLGCQHQQRYVEVHRKSSHTADESTRTRAQS